MKKISAIILAFVVVFGFAGCKNTEEPKKPVTEQTDAGEQAAEENKDVLSEYEPEAEEVEIPAVSADDVEDIVKENGGKDVKVNKDGTVDVDMTDAEYSAMMEKIGKTILEKLEDIRKSNDMIESVQTGLDFDKYYIFVDKAKYEANPSAIDIKDCCESAEVYHMLSGKKAKDIKLTLYIMNKDDDLELARKVYTIKE